MQIDGSRPSIDSLTSATAKYYDFLMRAENLIKESGHKKSHGSTTADTVYYQKLDAMGLRTPPDKDGNSYAKFSSIIHDEASKVLFLESLFSIYNKNDLQLFSKLTNGEVYSLSTDNTAGSKILRNRFGILAFAFWISVFWFGIWAPIFPPFLNFQPLLEYLGQPLYLFTWDDINTNNNKMPENLGKFLAYKFGITWANTATLEKSDGGKIITISNPPNSFSIRLNDVPSNATKAALLFEGREYDLKIERDTSPPTIDERLAIHQSDLLLEFFRAILTITFAVGTGATIWYIYSTYRTNRRLNMLGIISRALDLYLELFPPPKESSEKPANY